MGTVNWCLLIFLRNRKCFSYHCSKLHYTKGLTA